MMLIIYILTTVIMIVTTIALYETLRRSRVLSWFIMFIDKTPLLQFLFNFGVSYLIMIFTGTGMISGAANLTASILFPIYCTIRNKAEATYIDLFSGKKVIQNHRRIAPW